MISGNDGDGKTKFLQKFDQLLPMFTSWGGTSRTRTQRPPSCVDHEYLDCEIAAWPKCRSLCVNRGGSRNCGYGGRHL